MHRPLALAAIVLGAATSTVHAHPSVPGAADAGQGLGAAALGLVALALGAGAAALVSRVRIAAAGRLGAMATASLLAGSLTLAAPHLVHHALDTDRGASCPVLQIAGSVDAVPGTPVPAVVSAVMEAAEPALATPVRVRPLAAPPGRAPPA